MPVSYEGKTISDEVIRLADLFTVRDDIRGYRFSNCVFVGPGVVFLGDCRMIRCSFDGHVDAMLWNLPSPEFFMGAMVFLDCIFENCRFQRLGFTGTPDMLHAFRQVPQR